MQDTCLKSLKTLALTNDVFSFFGSLVRLRINSKKDSKKLSTAYLSPTLSKGEGAFITHVFIH